MPAFIFLMGLFCSKKNKAPQYLLLYMVFQTLFLLFIWLIGDRSDPLTLQYTTPYWILWFLLATIVYYAAFSYFQGMTSRMQIIFLVLSVLIALLAGLDQTIGYYFSLSRILVFAPFSFFGCFLNQNKLQIQARLKLLGKKRWLFCVALLVSLTVVLVKVKGISASMMYGSFSYAALSYNMGIRLFLMGIAGLWIVFLVILQSLFDYPIPVISSAGRHSLWIFLIHGFVLRYAEQKGWFQVGGIKGLCLVALASVFLIVLLGNQYLASVMDRLFLLKRKEK